MKTPLISDAPGGASVSGAVFNLSTSIIGAGIMSIPATFKVLGVGPALLLMAAVAFLSDASVGYMTRYTVHGASAVSSYAGLMGESFGIVGSIALQLCVVLTNLGALIMYLIIIGDVISGNGSDGGSASHAGILEEWFGEHWWNARALALLLTLLLILMPLVLLKRVVHPIWAELEKTSDMKIAVRISLLLCCIIYTTVGFFGYLLFGDSTMSDILSNFDHESSTSKIGPMLNDIVRLSYALHLILVFPLLNFSLRLNIDELLFSKKKPLASDNVRFVSLTVILMFFVYLATIAIPNIWVLFQFMGSTSAVCLSLIFPGAIVLRDIHGISTRRDKVLAGSMIVLAMITSSIAIATNVSNYFESTKATGRRG